MLSLNEIDNLEFYLSEYTAKIREIMVLQEFLENNVLARAEELEVISKKLGTKKINEKIYLHLLNEIQKKNFSSKENLVYEMLLLTVKANNFLNEARKIADIPVSIIKIKGKPKQETQEKNKNSLFIENSITPKHVGTKFSAITLRKPKQKQKKISLNLGKILEKLSQQTKKQEASKPSVFEESFKVPVYSVDIGLTDTKIKGEQTASPETKNNEVETLKKNIFSSAKHETRIEGLETLIPGYAYGKISEDENGDRTYIVIEPAITSEEKEIIEEIKNDLVQVLTIEELSKEKLFAKMEEIIKKKNFELDLKTRHKLVYYLSRDLLGLGKIEPLMHDPYIEDIECDGVNIPVYVIHKLKGHLPTNIVYPTTSELEDFIVKLSQLSNSYVSYASPLLNAILPDGSRVNAVLTSSISTKGPSYTLRLFPEKPLSPVNLLMNGTIDAELLAYLWTVLEFKKSVLIAGPTASGKTTMLNALAMFLPYGERIVSIEDTRELNLQHENWLPQVARPGFGPPDASGKRFGEISMMDLIRESFRQRPDYLIVGEVRGKETFVLFQGMASGHCAIATIHARSVNDLVSRLTTPPINLSPSLLESVDIVLNLGFAGEREIKRRVRSLAEIQRYDPRDQHLHYVDLVKELKTKTKKIQGVEILTSTEVKSFLSITEKSIKLQQISEEYDMPLKELQKRIDKRTMFLEKMKQEKVTEFQDFIKALEAYRATERNN